MLNNLKKITLLLFKIKMEDYFDNLNKDKMRQFYIDTFI